MWFQKKHILRLRVQIAFRHPVSLDNRLKPLCGYVCQHSRSYLLFLPKELVVFALAYSLPQNALEISSLLEVIIVNFEELAIDF
jgi:hypothetical protein